jgi:hypothetical protein
LLKPHSPPFDTSINGFNPVVPPLVTWLLVNLNLVLDETGE